MKKKRIKNSDNASDTAGEYTPQIRRTEDQSLQHFALCGEQRSCARTISFRSALSDRMAPSDRRSSDRICS